MPTTPRWLRVADNIIEEANQSPWRSDPANYISLASINGLRGRVPLPLLMERVWIDNCPQCQDFNRLSPEFREPVAGTGYIGGIANIPVDYARDQRLDPRDPWTSLYMLVTRLQDITNGRARQYSDMWTRINCVETGSEVLTTGALMWPGWGRALGLILNEFGDVGWRVVSQGVVEDRETSGSGPVEVPEKLCVGGAGFNMGEVGTRVYPQYAATTENYFGVRNDLGFWKAVFFEERVTTPYHSEEQRSRVEIMDRLWAEFLHGGLWSFLGDREGGFLIAGMLWHHGLVWTVSAFGWMQDVILHYNEYPPEVRDRLQLSPTDISMLRGHLDTANRIAQGAELTGTGCSPDWSCVAQPAWAGPDGAHTWHQPDWVAPDSINPGGQISLSLLRASAVGWSSETDRWAGALFQVPGRVESPRQPQPPRTPQPPGEPQPGQRPPVAASKVHPAIPFLVGVSIPLVGYLIVGGRQDRGHNGS